MSKKKWTVGDQAAVHLTGEVVEDRYYHGGSEGYQGWVRLLKTENNITDSEKEAVIITVDSFSTPAVGVFCLEVVWPGTDFFNPVFKVVTE